MEMEYHVEACLGKQSASPASVTCLGGECAEEYAQQKSEEVETLRYELKEAKQFTKTMEERLQKVRHTPPPLEWSCGQQQ